ncbi:hypothetical protein LCGC14_0338590 [marine sediment metagenome]|uniref:Transposase zinc-binding domain-containing protein n=1 Tax=marine sediment metagenome TaxID=412755 RepID=A0A0F9TEL5_9ZZZZ
MHGDSVSGITMTKAIRYPENHSKFVKRPVRAYEEKIRTCLGITWHGEYCDAKFLSWGPQNRFCGKCGTKQRGAGF